MKNFVTIILLFVASVAVSAQDFGKPTNHLKFMGIPMGKATFVVDKLVEKGYKIADTNEVTEGTVYTFKGTFASMNNCGIAVRGCKSGWCYECDVQTKEYGRWDELYTQYLALCSSLEEKYGPAKKERFEVLPPYDSDNLLKGNELTALWTEKLIVGKMYSNVLGIIYIQLTKDAEILLSYLDANNRDKFLEEVEKRMSNDL